MTIDDFTQTVSQVFVQSDGFSPETEFKKHPEWTSLVALILIATVLENFGVTLGGNDIVKARTVRDLFGVVVAKKSDNR